MTLKRLLFQIFCRSYLLLIPLLVIPVTTIVLSSHLVSLYSFEVKVWIKNRETDSRFLKEVRGWTQKEDTLIRVHRELLLSEKVVKQTIQELGLYAPKPLKRSIGQTIYGILFDPWVLSASKSTLQQATFICKKKIKITVENPEMLKISVRATSKELAKNLVFTLLKYYKKAYLDSLTIEAGTSEKLLQKRIEVFTLDVQQRRDLLSKFLEENEDSALDILMAKGKNIRSNYADLQKKREENLINLEQINSELESIAKDSNIRDSLAYTEKNGSTVNALGTLKAKLYLKIAEQKMDGEDSPIIQNLKKQIIVLEIRIQEETQKIIAQKKSTQLQLSSKEKKYQKILDGYERKLKELPVKQNYYNHLTYDLDQAKKNHSSILNELRKLRLSRISKRKDVASLNTITLPTPDVPVFPKKVLLLIGSVFGAFFLGIVLIYGSFVFFPFPIVNKDIKIDENYVGEESTINLESFLYE